MTLCICKHQKVPKLTLKYALKYGMSTVTVLRCVSVPLVAHWQVLAMLYYSPSNWKFWVFFFVCQTQQKILTAFRVRKCKKFILDNCISKCAFLYVFFCIYSLGLQGMWCGFVQLMEHRGVQGGIGNVTATPAFVPQGDFMPSHHICIS